MPRLPPDPARQAALSVWHSSPPALDVEAQAELTSALQQVSDLSTASPSLASLAQLPGARAALDSAACNVLRPLAHLFTGRRVLELGVGTGNITRYLGELADTVTALEPRAGLAALARARTRDQAHVHIVCADRLAEPARPTFDCIVALGLLDAPSAADIEAALQYARRCLTAGGTLVLGRHNRLQVLGRAGLAGAGQIASHSRLGLETTQQLLFKTGLRGQRVFAVFPSLGAARTVLSAEGARCSAEELAPVLSDLLLPPAPPSLLGGPWSAPAEPMPGDLSGPEAVLQADVRSLAFQGAVGPLGRSGEPHGPPSQPAGRLLHAGIDRDTLLQCAAEGLLLGLAPAQLVVARAEPLAEDDDLLAHPDDVAYGYATWRPKELCKESILRLHNGIREVVRRRVHSATPPRQGPFVQRLESEAVPPGWPLSEHLGRTLATPGWSAASIATTLRPWADLVRFGEGTTASGPDHLVAGHLIDVSPNNVAVSQGRAEAYALEWDLGRDVPLAWVLYRGLCGAFARQTTWAEPAGGEPLRVLPLVRRVLAEWQVTLSDELATHLALEERRTFGHLAARAPAHPARH